MAAISVEHQEGSLPAQLQLLILHCLSTALNQTHNSTVVETKWEDSLFKGQIVNVNIDKDIDSNIKESLMYMEQSISNKILEFESKVIDEVRKSSCKSEEMLSELVNRISNISGKNQELLSTEIKENSEYSRRNEELQIKLETLTQSSTDLQKTLTEENIKLSERNSNLQMILENVTEENSKLLERNKDLEIILGNVSDSNLTLEVEILQNKLVNQIEQNSQLQLKVQEKERLFEEQTSKLKEAKQKIEELNTTAEKYSEIQGELSLPESTPKYCKIPQNSVLWKLAHMDSQSEVPSDAYVWSPTYTEIEAGKMQIQYSSSQDKYVKTVDRYKLHGWSKGTYTFKNFFRMVEDNYEVAYLARDQKASEGHITWKFDLSDSGRSVETVRILFSVSLFNSGAMDVNMCSSIVCETIPNGDEWYETNGFKGVSQLEITANVSGGYWQYAQLFRQGVDDVNSYQFDITIEFNKCDFLIM